MKPECSLPSFNELLEYISRQPVLHDNQDPRFLRNKNTSQAAGQDMTISHFQETPLPVVSHRMGGRYSQTACHSNGQPHAEGTLCLPEAKEDRSESSSPQETDDGAQ
ncbi:hypothetical protein B0H10DRAFT_1184720 [Mycena sp. CBHHK59/15]|nr:hypothetical protein B0H10DRAFT_1184720 [Mycena sp. CBHHK59/15]